MPILQEEEEDSFEDGEGVETLLVVVLAIIWGEEEDLPMDLLPTWRTSEMAAVVLVVVVVREDLDPPRHLLVMGDPLQTTIKHVDVFIPKIPRFQALVGKVQEAAATYFLLRMSHHNLSQIRTITWEK